MSLEVLYRTVRKFDLLPILAYSIYLVIIYSNDFWKRMIGSTHLAVSVLLLLFSTAAIFFSVRAYDKDFPRPNNKQFYYFFSLLAFADSLSLIFLTRDIKKMECIYWVNYFLSTNANSFFVLCFNQLYSSSSSVDYFVHSRIINVHDTLICLVVITFVLFILLTFLFKKILKLCEKKSHLQG